MQDFEDVRNDFNGSGAGPFLLRLKMKSLEEDDPKCIQYDPEEDMVELTKSVNTLGQLTPLMQSLVMTYGDALIQSSITS